MGPLDENRNAVLFHALHRFVIIRPMARNDNAGKVPGPMHLSKRAPEQLEKGIGAVVVDGVLDSRVCVGEISIQGLEYVAREIEGCHCIRAVREHVVERQNRRFDGFFGLLSRREGLTVPV